VSWSSSPPTNPTTPTYTSEAQWPHGRTHSTP